jgi:glycosyltransferase involved in cell wall biosynthesis
MKIANILIDSKKQFGEDKVTNIERSFIDYALYLTEKNAEVLSVFKADEFYREASIEGSTQVLEISPKKFNKFYLIIQLWLKFLDFLPDIAICHSYKSFAVVRFARFFLGKKFPIISICSNENPNDFLKSDYIITQNSYLLKELVDLGKKRENILVINNSINVENDFKIIEKKPFSKPIKIGSIGIISLGKNFDKVLRAMIVLRSRGIDCEYSIAGSGDYEDELNLLANELRLEKNFKILGFANDKKNFFENIDICAMPIGKGFSSESLLDPMLYSTPLISSNSHNCDEIIDHDLNGLKININDEKLIPTLIADAIEKLVNNEVEAKQMAKRACEKIFDHYSSEVVANRIFQICKKINEDFVK